MQPHARPRFLDGYEPVRKARHLEIEGGNAHLYGTRFQPREPLKIQ